MSTLEMLIAFALLNLALFAVAVVVFSNQRVASDIEISAEAQGLAGALLELARAQSRADFNLVNPTSSVEKSGLLTYTKTLAVAQLDPFTKQATGTVSWQSGTRTLSSVFSTLLTNPLASLGGGTTCSSVVTGDWKHPQHKEWDLGDLGVNGGNGNGFGISNVAVFNKKIYLTMYATPNTDKDTVFIFQDNGANIAPTFLGSVDNDAASSVGPNALVIASTTSKIYAYLASPSSFNRGQLQVVDVTTPNNPTVVKTFKIPTTAVPSAGTPFTIAYKNGYVYLGLSKITGGGSEFNIIDVGGGTGTPLNPVWKGGYDTGSAVNEIYIRGNYAYLATPATENLTVLDISNPAAPVRVGGYTPPNAPESNGVGSNHGETVMAVGSTVYLGRTYGTKEFYILNANNPASVLELGSVDVGAGNSPSIYGLAVRDYLAFFITNTQFQVWDISNPASIKPYTSDGTTSTFLALSALGGTGTAQDCESNYFYLAVASSQGNTKDMLSVISPGP
jgi:type II secretory pathway pseudopilin PulG